jgi:hypothetical protein
MNKKEGAKGKAEVVRRGLDGSSIFSPQTVIHPSLRWCRMRFPVSGRQEPLLDAQAAAMLKLANESLTGKASSHVEMEDFDLICFGFRVCKTYFSTLLSDEKVVLRFSSYVE